MTRAVTLIASLIAEGNAHQQAGRFRMAGRCYLDAADLLAGSTIARPALLAAACTMHDRALAVEQNDDVNAADPRRW